MTRKYIFILMFCVLFILGCGKEDTSLKDYERCTSVCSSVLSDDFVTLQLCQEECKKEFLLVDNEESGI